MSDKPTAYRLSIYLSFATICVFVAFIFIVYNYNRNLLYDNINKNAVSLSSQVKLNVKSNIITTREISSNISTQIDFYVHNNSIEQFLTGLLKRYEYIQSIHIELDESIFQGTEPYYSISKINGNIQYNEGGLPINNEGNVYQSTKDFFYNNKTGWTEPYYIDNEQNKLVVSFCSPVSTSEITGDLEIIGNISIELSLSYLDQAINNVKVGKNGYSFLVANDGAYITHPDKSKILVRNITELANEIYNGDENEIQNILKSKETGFSESKPDYLKGQRSWVYFTPVVENDWTLFLIIPYSELYRDLHILLFRMIIIAFSGLIVIFFLVHYISYRLMKPLKNITHKIQEFSSGKTNEPVYNEVYSLSKSLNTLQALYIKNQRKQKQILVNDKKNKYDLEQASQIQQNIIPNTFPVFPGHKEIDIYSIYRPAFSISGDLYDYFFIDKRHLLITIGDVSGKGIPAAFFMGVAHTLLRNNSTGMFPKKIVSEINNELCNKNQNQFFLTLFLGIFDIKSGCLDYCNAAHTSSKILKEDGSILELENAHGLPLGLYSEKKYNDSTVKLSKNDTLVIYTDGIIDQRDQDGEHFGEIRLKNNLERLKGTEPENLINRMEKSLDIFKGKAHQNDDISLVVLKYLAD